MLQQQIAHACSLQLLAHPFSDTIPCPVLQYADDTLIILRATNNAAVHLRKILDDFADATGLQIDFNKTTFVPIHLSQQEADYVATTLGTSISSFPQTYLGLPLSSTKLNQADFQPIIDNVDKYLAGWTASLLSKGGRLILLSAVLDSLPTHFMSSILLPASVIHAIDSKRRAFFWAADDTCTGAQCLVAWDRTCTPKTMGGLGVKNLNAQNVCLLLKFCFKFLHSDNTPWKQWIANHSPFATHTTNPAHIGKILAKHMHLLTKITTCTVGNGKSVFFWHDSWLLNEPLADAFPALFSHHLNQNNLVSDVLQNGVESGLRNRLTMAATQQLAALSLLLQGTTLTDDADSRLLLDGSAFSTRGAYVGIQTALLNPDADRVWASRVPNKVKIFGWLLLLDRLNTRANLRHKHILDYELCPRFNAPKEDRHNLFISCPYAAQVWQKIGIQPNAQPFRLLWDSPIPPHMPHEVWDSVLLIILWKIWDARNASVFRSIDQPASVTIKNIIHDLTLWAYRFSKADMRLAADLWRDHLTLCNM